MGTTTSHNNSKGADELGGIKSKIPLSEKNYPPPKPPVRRKAEFFAEEMLSLAKKNVANSYADELLEDYDQLITCLKAGTRSDLEIVCNIFAFLTLCNSSENNCLDAKDAQSVMSSKDHGSQYSASPQRASTPKAYLRAIDSNVTRLTLFFTLLCRKLSLPCVLITGIAKGAAYVVGDTDLSKFRNVWTAVYIDGEWRFVHPLWAFKSVANYNEENWHPVETVDGQLTSDEKFVNSFMTGNVNVFWFLTDPEWMINWCFPDNCDWQLLETPITLNQFTSQLYRRESFFDMGLSVRSHDSCHLTTSSGYTEIILKVPDRLHSFIILYDLYHKTPHSVFAPKDNLKKCVAISKDLPLVKCEMQFPVAEDFILNLFGSKTFTSKTLEWLCSFKITCLKAVSPFIPYPQSPYMGWGAGADTDDAGLKPVSHTSSQIQVHDKDPIEMRFRLLRNVVVIADLICQSEEYEPIVVSDTKNEIRVIVRLPDTNENYGLALYTKNVVNNTVKNAINYLIKRRVEGDKTVQFNYFESVTNDTENGKSNWKSVQRKVLSYEEIKKMKKLKMRLGKAAIDEDPHNLDQIIKAYETCGYAPCVELTLAQKQLSFLQHKEALHSAMNLKQADALQKALENIKKHEYRMKISAEVLKTAETLLVRLQLLERTRKRVSEMNNRSVNEVRRYNRAVQTVHDIVAAVYALLGETSGKLGDWKYVQMLLGRDGPRSVVRLVETCPVTDLTDERVATCRHYLGNHNLNECLIVSNEIAAFYQWVMSMLENYDASIQQSPGS